jgi:hypothetical protein
MPAPALRVVAVVVAAALCVLSGCRRTPELRPRLILHGEPVGDDFWLDAPYIAAVKVLSVEPQGSLAPLFQGGPKTLQLVKFVVTVENVIKGNLPERTIAFFFFTKRDQNPEYVLYPGRRYITSLRKEGAVWRSWADATQLKSEVHSGSHNQADLPLDRGPGGAIAYILLTPGTDCDLTTFKDNLFVDRFLPPHMDPRYISKLLGKLQLHPDAKLRYNACFAASTMLEYRPTCLDAALKSPDAEIRESAEFRIKQTEAEAEVARQAPFDRFRVDWITYMTQTFEVQTEDTRPEVRKAACENLRTLAPRESFRNCR